jgi:hypothetical protein
MRSVVGAILLLSAVAGLDSASLAQCNQGRPEKRTISASGTGTVAADAKCTSGTTIAERIAQKSNVNNHARYAVCLGCRVEFDHQQVFGGQQLEINPWRVDPCIFGTKKVKVVFSP